MFKHIVVAVDVDDPDSWKSSLPIAQAIVRCFGAQLTLCSVSSELEALASGEWSAISYQEELAKRHAALDALAAGVDSDIETTVEVGTGAIPNGVVDVAERIGADLIVLSSGQHKILRYLVSAKADRVARKAPCSVLIIRS